MGLTPSPASPGSSAEAPVDAPRKESAPVATSDGARTALRGDLAGETLAPTSFAQERLWILRELGGGAEAYHLFRAFRLRGALDTGALSAALAEVVRRHESLRTTFREVDGEAMQVIAPFTGFTLAVEDAAPSARSRGEADGNAVVEQRARDEAARSFDLAAGPLFRATLLRLGDEDHALFLDVHHAVADGLSLGVIFRELAALYDAFREGRPSQLPPPALQYAAYARWIRKRVARAADSVAWWKARLAGAPALLALPTDRSRPAVQTYRGARVRFTIAAETAARLEALARDEGVTLYMVLLAGWQTLLARYSGDASVVVGSSIANRPRAELEAVVGFFVNTLALRTGFDGDPDFREVLRRVREGTLGAFEHQEVPFERLVEELQPERSMGHNPVFQAFFAFQNGAPEMPRLHGVRVEPVTADPATAKFDLSLFLTRTGAGLEGMIEYATDLFDAATAERIGAHLGVLLAAAAADRGRPVSRLPLATADERALLARWSGEGSRLSVDGALHHRFEAHAAAHPAAPAVTCGGETLAYGELNARANRLARRLAARGVRAEARVGLCAERSLDLVVGILAIVKAGGAYVPLDPAYPAERLAYIAGDAGIRVVLAPSAHRDRVPGAGVELVALDGDLSGETADDLGVAVLPENLAYVIYTSGSTGHPKGVGVTHANVLRLFDATQPSFAFGAGDVWTLFHSYAFDFSVWETWGALLHGGRLVVVPWETSRDPGRFRGLLADERVTVLNQTPSAFRALCAADEAHPEPLAALRAVVFGGEALRYEALRGWLDRYGPRRPRLVNMYGITETTVHVTWHTVTGRELRDGAAGSGVGVPIPDLRTYVLDAAGNPAPVGVPGELYVGGAGLARGYLGRPGLTATRFVPDPFSGDAGARLYRSGDRARWTADGTLEYLGRLDQQVKVRGFRVEPGEIEALLLAQPSVAAAAVVVRGDGDDAALVAYVVPAGPHGCAAPALRDALRDALRERLPEHMVPSAFVALERIPLTANGKLDRAALPAPGAEADAPADAFVAPRNAVEAAVAEIWSEVLKTGRVGVTDGFFELGGHSLLATRVVSRIRETLDGEVSVAALFRNPTVEALSATLSLRHSAGAEPAPDASDMHLLAALGTLSDDELDRLLAASAGGGAE